MQAHAEACASKVRSYDFVRRIIWRDTWMGDDQPAAVFVTLDADGEHNWFLFIGGTEAASLHDCPTDLHPQTRHNIEEVFADATGEQALPLPGPEPCRQAHADRVRDEALAEGRPHVGAAKVA